MNRKSFFPAEWHPQSAIQLTWPHEATDWNGYLDDICKTYVEMADAITQHERLVVVSPSTDDVKAQLSKKLSPEQLLRVIYHQCPTNDTWARDHGFLTLVDDTQEPKLLDFRFNGWGEKFPSVLDNAINRSLYAMRAITGRYENHNDFVLEGGSIESDGRGTVFTTKSCLLAPNRNQPRSQGQIEQFLKDYFHCERVVWIDYGHLEGDDTDGHIDTLVRIAPDDTLLYVACSDKNDSHYKDLKKMEQQLQLLKTIDGKAYRLLPLPLPKAIYDGEERLPATYANFVVLNEAVLCPTYGQQELDREAMATLGEAFPEREIIPIDSLTVIRQHGSLHCCTMQFPIEVNVSGVREVKQLQDKRKNKV